MTLESIVFGAGVTYAAWVGVVSVLVGFAALLARMSSSTESADR